MMRMTRAIVLTCSIAAAAVPLAAQTRAPARYESLAREFLEELIEINTTHSVGNTTVAAEAMARRLIAAGFPQADVQVMGPVGNRGNLVARLRGRDSGKKPVIVMAHLDVVEADASDWTVDPFDFLERDGYFYGRGTTDDKDEAAIWTVNLIRMKQDGFVPDRDVILLLTADEEGGPNNGIDWLVRNHRELIDAAYAINEGGGGMLKDGKRLSNTVQASEKVYQSFQFEVTNPGGHSSLPRRDNAIYDLAAALVRIGQYDFPVQLNEVTRAFFERTAAIESPEIAQAMGGVLQDPSDAAAVDRLARTPGYNARLRTTCVATLLDGGHAQNALPQRAQAVVNCRILPGHDPADVQRTLERVVANPNVNVTPIGTATPSPPSPLTPEIVSTIERVTHEMWPGVPVIPTMSTGATDGLYLRNAGIPVYGVSGIFNDVDDVRAHGQDERISTRSFYEGLEFTYRLLKALTTGPTP